MQIILHFAVSTIDPIKLNKLFLSFIACYFTNYQITIDVTKEVRMIIAPEVTGQVTQLPHLANTASLIYRETDKTAHVAAQAKLHQFSPSVTQSPQSQRQISHFSAIHFLVSSLLAIQGIGKTALMASVLFSRVYAGAPENFLSMSAPITYAVIPGSNVSLANPSISVSVNWAGSIPLKSRLVECILTLSLPLPGRLFISNYSPGNDFYADSLDSKILGLTTNNTNSLNIALQHLTFEGKSIDISSTLTVYCFADSSNQLRSIKQTSSPGEKTAVITLTGKYQPPVTTIPTTLNVITTLSPSSQPLVSTSSTPISSQRPTSSSGPILTSSFSQGPTTIQSPTSASFSSPGATQITNSMLLITPALSPNGNTVQITPLSALSNPTSNIPSEGTTYSFLTLSDNTTLAIDISLENNISSSEKSFDLTENGTLQWIIVAVAGVALLSSMLGLAGYVVHRKKHKAKPKEPKIDTTSNDRKSSAAYAAQETTVPIKPRAPYPQQEPQFFDAHSARESQGIVVSQHYLNAPGNFDSFRTTQHFNTAVFENHQYVNIASANQNPQVGVQVSNATGYMFVPNSHYHNPHDRIRELELNPPQPNYVGINDV